MPHSGPFPKVKSMPSIQPLCWKKGHIQQQVPSSGRILGYIVSYIGHSDIYHISYLHRAYTITHIRDGCLMVSRIPRLRFFMISFCILYRSWHYDTLSAAYQLLINCLSSAYQLINNNNTVPETHAKSYIGQSPSRCSHRTCRRDQNKHNAINLFTF